MAAALLALPGSAAMAANESAACAPGASPYPSFCDIPRTPTDVRGAGTFKTAVVDLRRTGRRLVRATAPGTFGLPTGEADAFSQAGRAEAAPPAEVSGAPSGDSEAYAAELRRRAKAPPPRPPR